MVDCGFREIIPKTEYARPNDEYARHLVWCKPSAVPETEYTQPSDKYARHLELVESEELSQRPSTLGLATSTLWN